MAGRVENINKDILRQCREQIGLSISEIEKKIPRINKIEQGQLKPTFKQLDALSELYKVPRWVFISDSIPEQYQFYKAIPAFRQLKDSNTNVFSDYKVRSLTARVERFRSMILELYEDMDEKVAPFLPPEIKTNTSPNQASQEVRNWLKISNERYDFIDWKKKLETKGIFVFMTSKYKGWSHIDKTLFRGLTIYYSKLPIIVINDSDFKKAQTLTLIHELGHLLKKESTIDEWEDDLNNVEAWCDQFAGCVLMPAEQLLSVVPTIDDIDDVKSIAKDFKVSPYACLVRLRQLQIINHSTYIDFENQLKTEYRIQQKKLKQSRGGPVRNRAIEILNQYGNIYTTAVFQAYHNQEISFSKLCQLFDIRKPSYALELEGYL